MQSVGHIWTIIPSGTRGTCTIHGCGLILVEILRNSTFVPGEQQVSFVRPLAALLCVFSMVTLIEDRFGVNTFVLLTILLVNVTFTVTLFHSTPTGHAGHHLEIKRLNGTQMAFQASGVINSSSLEPLGMQKGRAFKHTKRSCRV
jgi:hypothetical protein